LPQKAGTFLLGIECDGASYHSGRSARDRDRLRQEILENLGWKIHRVWSTDWFKSRDGEIKKMLRHIEGLLENDPAYKLQKQKARCSNHLVVLLPSRPPMSESAREVTSWEKIAAALGGFTVRTAQNEVQEAAWSDRSLQSSSACLTIGESAGTHRPTRSAYTLGIERP
jgi:hypothetical protein